MERIRICPEFYASSVYIIYININYVISGLRQTTLGIPLLMSSALRLLGTPTQTTRHAFLHIYSNIKANACAIQDSSVTDCVITLQTCILSLMSVKSKLIFITKLARFISPQIIYNYIFGRTTFDLIVC